MPVYRNTYNGVERTSADALGYPWIEISEAGGAAVDPQTELAERTADAILADVGIDGDLAQEALDREQARDTPRTSLIAKLERIVRNAES